MLIFTFRRVRTKKPFHGSSFHGYVGGTSGSEDVCESSMESIESYNNISLKHLTGLSLGPQPASPRQAANIRNKMSMISSADSLLSMIRNLASSKMSISSPSSPQLSDNGDMASSGKHYCSNNIKSDDLIVNNNVYEKKLMIFKSKLEIMKKPFLLRISNSSIYT